MGQIYILLLSLLLVIDGLEGATTNSTKKLVIDHDGGADDALAIFITLLYEKYFQGPSVIGLTTTHGNVNESQCFINSQRILDQAGRQDVSIYRGSKDALIKGIESDHYFGVDGLGDNATVSYAAIESQEEHAVLALIELSKTYEGELVVIAIGSMTNIALAIRLDPEFIDRLDHLYVGAGHIYSETNPSPEFNAAMDPEAYHIVVESATSDKVTVIPFSQIEASLNITKEWRKTVLGAISTSIIEAQNSYEQVSLASSSTVWSLLDPAVASIAVNNAVVNGTKYSENDIILCGDERGINTNNFTSAEPNVEIIYSANQDIYEQMLVDVFSAELNTTTV